MIAFLTVDEVVTCHDMVLARYGGCPGCPDPARIDVLIGRVIHYVLYENIQDSFAIAAMYCVAIAQGHAFVDSNKRTAACCMFAVLQRNGIHPTPRKELLDAIVSVADKSMSLSDLTELLKKLYSV